jgi:hypothetical protein
MDIKDYWSGMKYDDFFLKGYEIFYEDDLDATNIIDVVAEKYISPMWPEYKLMEFDISEKIDLDDNICVWHNDSSFGFNLTFLYYLDDMSPEIGGAISIRNGMFEDTIYPKKGMLLMLSQKPNVQHKVEYTEAQRRVYGLDFKVEGL